MATKIQNFNFNINAVRCYAILLIVFLHAGCIYPEEFRKIYEKILSFFDPQIGVEILFVIAGYFLSNWLFKKDNYTLSEIFSFYWKKLKRLFPVAIVWSFLPLLFCVILGTPHWLTPEAMWKKFISGALMLRNFEEVDNHSAFGYLWAVSLEFQFFVIFPIVYFTLGAKKTLVLSFLFLLLSCFYRNEMFLGGGNSWMFRIDGLIYGYVLAYFKYLHNDVFFKISNSLNNLGKRKNFFIFSFVLILSGSSLIALQSYPQFKFSISAFICFIFIGFLLTTTYSFEPSLPFLRKITRYIASRSYSLYCCHIPSWFAVDSILSIFAFAKIHMPALLTFLIQITVMLVSMELTFKFVEQKKWD